MLGKVANPSMSCEPVSGLVWSNNTYPNDYGFLTFDLSCPNHNVSVTNAAYGFTGIENQNMEYIFELFLTKLVENYPFIKIFGLGESIQGWHFRAFRDGGNYFLYSQNGEVESDPITLTLKRAGMTPESDIYKYLGSPSNPPSMKIHTCGLSIVAVQSD